MMYEVPITKLSKEVHESNLAVMRMYEKLLAVQTELEAEYCRQLESFYDFWSQFGLGELRKHIRIGVA